MLIPGQKDPPADRQGITAIILAGGKSSRIGQEKGLINFNGKMLVQHVIDIVKKITGNIVIVTAHSDYKQFGFRCVEDEMQDKGPLGGIYTGLVHTSTQKNLLVGCDMPFLSERIIMELITACGNEDVLLTEHFGLAEPLCSVYDRSCILHIRPLLEQNQLKITDAFEGLKTRVISFDKEDWFRGDEFANINSIEELRKFET